MTNHSTSSGELPLILLARTDQGHDSGRPVDSGNRPEDRIENDPHLPYAGDDLEHPEHAKDPQGGKHAAVRHEGNGDDAEVEDIPPILGRTPGRNGSRQMLQESGKTGLS